MSRRNSLRPVEVNPLYGHPIYPNNGYPARPGENRPGLSPFGRLAMCQTLGKSSILIYDARADPRKIPIVDMIAIEGDDLDAQQLVLTLHPPRVVPLPFSAVRDVLGQQNLTGEQDNAEVTAGNFPGTPHPIRWPPLEAQIEFGVGGVSTKAIVDYTNGITLSVQASYLRAHALVSQSREGDIFGTSAAYYLAAHVGPGFAESHTQRTIFLGEVDDGDETPAFDVPKFAKLARLVGCRADCGAPVITVGWVRFWQSPNGTNCVADLFVANHETRIEVSNAGQYFTVLNQSGHCMRMSVIFELAL